MSRHFSTKALLCVAVGLFLFASLPSAWAQHTQGRINVTVLDQQNAIVIGAKLELRDLATNDLRTAETRSAGTYTFVNLPAGKFKLTVTKEGFETAVYDVIVETAKTADVEAVLRVGALTTVVEVGAVAPVTDVTQNAIGQVIDLRHIENLPITGRDIRQLAQLSAGYTGTWNGLPTIAQSSNIDGVQQGPTRMKYSGMPQSVTARLENIEEMTVQTDQLDLNQGFGQGAMQINFTTRRGTNDYHGMVFWDYRNDNLNANSWSNNMRGNRRPEFKLNDFGGNIGGRIFRDKLFFFFALSTARQPGSSTRTSTWLIPTAQTGTFTYVGTDSVTRTVDLFALAQAYNTANGTTLPTSVNSVISGMFSRVNTAIQQGNLTSTQTPILNTVSWLAPNPQTWWYPTLRLDYTPFQKLRMNLAVNRTKRESPSSNTPYFPGDDFVKWVGGFRSDNFTASYGIDLILSQTLLNSFKFGYLYNASFFGYNATREYLNNPVNIWLPLVTTPQQYYRPLTSSYPVFNISNTTTWQKGAHAFNFGFTYYREFDHYWNPPEGIADVNLDVVNGDPALNAFTGATLAASNSTIQGQAQDLYALLTGRVSNIFGRYAYDPSTGNYKTGVSAYNLAELSKAWALFFQDSWRIRTDLTINAGLRWDFTGNNVDLTGAYHNLDVSSLYGPTAVGQLFKPGTLGGNMNPEFVARSDAYNAWNFTPQPSLGFAWNPRFEKGLLNRLMGDGKTVIRASFSLRRFTVPYQYYWDNASAYGSFFYQFFSAQPGTAGVGYFTPGSLALGQPWPTLSLSPVTYTDTAPMTSVSTFIGGGPSATGIQQNIRQPYTMTWTFGIQRKLGESRAIEIRYNGNRTVRQWIAVDLNEINVFENGFLQEFINAQKNLAINGGTSFANLNPAGGTVPLPIFTTAFTGSSTGSQTNSNFRSNSFLTPLNTGSVGTVAQLLVRGSSSAAGGRYFCNLVGAAAFAPCGNPTNYTGGPNGPGGGYPINFFLANPFAIRGTGDGVGASYMTDAGWSNYNALQVDFRQRLWHGLQVNANYTWSHTLGVTTPDDWTAGYTAYTIRNLRQSYGPTRFDVRHVFNVSSTIDLPFGRGRKWLNRGGVVDKFIGGWTIGTITTYRTGYPFRVTGGYSTFNNFADGGVNLLGVSIDQLQSAIGVYKAPNQTFVSLIDPKYRTIGVGANTTYLTANTTPGTLAPVIWLHGPHGFYSDIMISKTIPITERWQFNFQTEFLNAFNHPVFGNGTNPIGGNIRSSSWGTTTGASNGPRVIEFRVKISF